MPDIYDQLIDQQSALTVPGAPVPAATEPSATATPAPAEPKKDVYDHILDKGQRDVDQSVLTALSNGVDQKPERAAQIQELAKSSGLPAGLVERNFDVVQKREQVKRLQATLATSPVLKAQMANPQFAALAHRDVEPLSGIEKLLAPAVSTMRAIPAGLQKVASNVVFGVPEVLMRAGSDYAGQYLAGTILPEDPFARMASGLQGFRKSGEAVGDAVAGDKQQGFVAGSIVSGAESFGRMLPGLAAAIITRNPAYAIGLGALDQGTQSAIKGLDNGLGVSRSIAWGMQDAVAEAVTERLPMGKLIGDLKAGAPFWKILRNQIATEVPTELAATAWQNFNEWANLNPDKPFSSYLSELPEAELQTLIATVTSTVLTAGLGKGLGAVADRAQLKQAQAAQGNANANILAQLHELAAASETAANAPATFAHLVDQVAEAGSPIQNIYIDGNTLMQSGLAATLTQASPSVAAQLEQAVATGGLVSIPLAEYAANIAPTEYAQTLLPHLKTDPEGMSQAEAQEYLQSGLQQVQQDMERTLVEQHADDSFRASADNVRQNILTQLQAANRFTPQVNDAYAALTTQFFTNAARRLGITPVEAFERAPLSIQAEHIGGQQFDQGVITPAFKEWFGESKVVDDTGEPIVLYRGVVGGENVPEGALNAEPRGDYAVFASSSPYVAASYGQPLEGETGALTPVYVKADQLIEFPVRVNRLGWREFDKFEFDRVARGLAPGQVLVARQVNDQGPRANLETDPDKLYSYASDIYAWNNGTSVKSATGNRGTFDAKDPNILNQAARGAFNPSTNTISLLKAADLSTFLHESGHFFLEAQINMASDLVQQSREGVGLTQGEQDLVQDAQVLLDWFGVGTLAEWHNLDFEEKRSYHERFARGFEAYLFEGNAPSIEMQGAFRRFRAWLVNVYKDLKALNVELTDDVRHVMDRMLASDEQIQTAQYARSMMPLFESPDAAGMTPEEFADYQAAGQGATEEAQAQLSARGVRDMQWMANARGRELKRLQKAADALRQEARIEARREIMSQPIYRAWQFLTSKLAPEDRVKPSQGAKSNPNVVDPTQDSLLVAIAKLGGIQRDKVQSEWGLDPKEKIAQTIFGKPVLRKTGGMRIDDMRVALEQYGYLNNDHQDPNWDPNEFEWKFFDELGGTPVYSSAHDYSKGQAIAGQDLDLQAVAAGRLDRGELMAMYPGQPEVKDVLAARRMTAANGLHPDLVADLFDFSSGDELVQALIKAQPPELEIEALTDLRMLEQHGDLATPEAIARAADQAIHNEVRARVIATELSALATSMGQRETVGQDKNGRRLTVAAIPRAARQFAETMVSRLKIRDLRPARYAAAETRAATAAEKAFKAADLQQAAAEKRNQLVNAYATRAAYQALDEVESTLRYFKKFSVEGTRRNLDTDYLNQIDALLEKYDLRKRSNRDVDRTASLRTWVQSRLNAGEIPDIAESLLSPAERSAYLSKVQSRDEDGNLVFSDDEDAIKLLAEAVDSSATRHYKDLTVEELAGLRDTIKSIEHLARLKNTLLTAAENRDYEAVRDEIALGITDNARASGKNTRTATSLTGRALQAVKAFGAEHIKASTWARIMDGGKDNGPVWRYLIRPANERANQEANLRAQTTQRLGEILQPILKNVSALDKVGKGRYFPSIDDSLNWQERFTMALNLGNESNTQRLLDGKGWTMQQIKPVLDTLTAQEWLAVQAVWDHFESFRPLIAEKELRVAGKEPEWIVERPLTVNTADGQTITLRGGYYPVKFDARVNLKASQHGAAEESKTKLKAAYGAATTHRSFVKTRVEEVKGRPLLLSLQGMYAGFNDVIHDLSWHEWVIDANKLLKSKTIDQAIREHYGPEVKHEFERWRDDIVLGSRRMDSAAERTIGFVRQNVSAAALTYQLFTAAMQPLGLANSVARVGGQWVAKGAIRYMGSPLASTREAMQKSSFLANRTRTRFRELNELRNQVQGQTAAREIMGRYGYWLMMRTQLMIDVPTWWGAYEKGLAGGQTEETAIALADQAVKDAQGGGETLDQAGIERGGPYHKLFTAFYSYMGSTLNTAYASAKTDSKGKAAANILMMVMVPAVLQSLLKDALTPGGDGDWEDWLKKLPAEILSFLAGLMVFVRELDPAIKALTGQHSFGYSGPAGLRMFSDVVRLGGQVAQGEFDRSFRSAFINVLGDLTGLPSVQVNRTLSGAEALSTGETSNPAALLFGFQRR